MFYSLSGKIVTVQAGFVAIDCGGVAFRCNISLNTLSRLPQKGGAVTLYTYLSVKEDSLELFGFYDERELECFRLLIGISGVGPKAALAVLSELTPDALSLAVSAADVKAVTRAQGVGPKLAQRIVLELKGKLSPVVSEDTGEVLSGAAGAFGENADEAVSALVFLGYGRSDAKKAVASLDRTLSVEEMIKQALNLLAANL